ncbi:MAG TPA: glucan biosynthesis protein [Geminicoccaceae bacterium]|nr:glucan biosynthesis protein [Geminicoccaceae bacterium]
MLRRAAADEAAAQQQPAADDEAFGFERVRELARRLAEQEFRDAAGNLPESLKSIGYDEYRMIRYRPEQGLWLKDSDVLFRVEFFHLGFYYQRPVRVNMVDQGLVLEVKYSPELFNYGRDGLANGLPDDLGFAGFKLRHPLDRDDVYDEVAAFLGASYFRILGRGQHYGISARGLAVDTALPSGEDFPFFREFWLEKPAPGATGMTFYALLDGASVTGAYRFLLDPGRATRLEVTAAVYPRRTIERLGVAPLTSMFLFGENSPPRFDDFRPEVHDSDGLAVHNGGDEWLWRPLDNRRELQVSSFVDTNPRGFGLFQRDRAFAHYQDLEAMSHIRPSYWVEPVGEWGQGVVQLVEIPSDREVNDNVVAYWAPAAPVEAGRPVEFAYRLHAQLEAPGRPPLGRTEATRIGPGATEGSRRFVLDFTGGPLEGLEPDAPVELVAETARGEIPLRVVQPNPVTGGWRVFFDFVPPADEVPADLRCFLRLDGRHLTETWLYLWTAS